jgi:phytoene desaturase
MPARIKQRSRLSMGLFVLFFGTKRSFPGVNNHTIILGKDFRGHLDRLFNKHQVGTDLSLYLHRPSATDPTFAPPGMDSFYALCPVPNLRAGIDWQTEGPRLQEAIIDKLQATVLPDLRASISDVFYDTPSDFQSRYLSVDGAGFSIAPHFTQSAWFRFHNRGEGIAGLYLVGAGTHPGAGIPGVLCSAKATDCLIAPVS